jgi:lipoprotein-anchoring transpeptidase ErfK/SrfK
MSQEDIERTLRDAFAAQARGSVGDAGSPPPPRFAGPAAHRPSRRVHRFVAPLAAAAAVLAVVGGIVAIAHSDSGDGQRHVAAGTRTSGPLASSTPSANPKLLPVSPARSSGAPSVTTPARVVHIRLFNADGHQYGVGMPVVAYFSNRIGDARPLASATAVTVNGRPIEAAWYFMPSPTGAGAMEGHLRPAKFWPAHAKVHVTMKAAGLPAGDGLRYDNTLTLDFTTGARTIAMVNDQTHNLTVTSDGRTVQKMPVSLGAKQTPTMSGVKVIMEKGQNIAMRGPGYYDPHVKYTQRLTYGGEYLHAAPWNGYNITHGIDSSNGCTNLLPNDAALLYKILQVGDVVEYPNVPGPAMSVTSGFGDWNVSWSTWKTGGLVPTN